MLQYRDGELVPRADRAALNSNVPVQAVANAAVLASSSYLGVVTRHAHIPGRDWETLERKRFDVTGMLLTSNCRMPNRELELARTPALKASAGQSM
jgi:hypothetical protein